MVRAAKTACASIVGGAASVTFLAATAHAATQRPYVNPNPYFMEAHPVLGTVIILYIVIAGLIMFPTVRRPLLHWYRSQTWFVRGGDPIDVLFKQIGIRLSVEGFAFMVACLVGALGGWIYVLLRSQPDATAEAQVAD